LLNSEEAITSSARITLIAKYHIARVTKPNGRWIETAYIGSEKNEKSEHNLGVLKWQNEITSLFNFRLEGCFFREDNEIWKDTNWATKGSYIPNNHLKGYWTMVSRKSP